MKKGKRGREGKMGKKKRKKGEAKGRGKTTPKNILSFSQGTLQVCVYLSQPQT